MICRLCLGCEGYMNSALDSSLQLGEKIRSVSRVQILITKDLPATVCIVCTQKVEEFYNFQQQIEKSNETLKQWVGDGMFKNYDKNADTKTMVSSNSRQQNHNANENSSTHKAEDDLYTLELYAELDQQVEKAPRIVETLSTELPDITSSDPAVNYICLICLKEFVSDEVKTHAKTHFKDFGSKQNEAPFKCEICSGTFHARLEFVTHQRAHFKVKPFKCKKCRRHFGSLGLIGNHIEKEECEDDKLLRCEYCGSLFITKHDLATHIFKHRDNHSHKCELCQKRLSNIRTYHAHMKYHRTGKQFMCEKCPKSYYTMSQLKLHLRTHGPTKTHLCCLCGKCFSSSVELKRHMSYHSRIKLFKCRFCESVFNENWHREEHVRLKHGDASFICEMCGKVCYSMRGLKKHIKRCQVKNEDKETNSTSGYVYDQLNVASALDEDVQPLDFDPDEPCLIETIEVQQIAHAYTPEHIKNDVQNAEFILITETDNSEVVNKMNIVKDDVALYVLAGDTLTFNSK